MFQLRIRVNLPSLPIPLYPPVASMPIPGGRSLRPVKNRGNFDKVVNQNFPPIFHRANYTLNKTFPLFFTFHLFFHSPQENFLPIFTPTIFQSTSLTKLSLKREEAQNGGET